MNLFAPLTLLNHWITAANAVCLDPILPFLHRH